MILERDVELGLLRQLLSDLESTGGRVVLIRGEAGIGKTALVTEFVTAAAEAAHVLEGVCDDLLTPQPFGPIWDIARAEPSVADPLARDDRRGVLDALLDLMSRRLRPTAVVLEDTQWADEATLDVIRFIGRRIARTNGLLILTYRSGEVDANHPLRQVIGDLSPPDVERMHLETLSSGAVAAMIRDAALDLQEVLTLTGGNPLFVREVVASGMGDVPTSIRDLVLAQAARLSQEARRALDLVSVTPGESERALVDQILGSSDQPLRECERHGLLHIDDTSASFRHELARRAIEASLSPTERRRLNERVLAALADHGDPARLVHHARQADDIDAIIDFAPRAARAAIAMESHREALAHFHALQPHLDHVEASDRAAILDDWARSAYVQGRADAPEVIAGGIALRRSLDDDRALARSLSFAARVYEVNGLPEQATECAQEAVTILEAHPPSTDLAFAVGQQAWLRLRRGIQIEGSRLADRALSIAAALGDDLTRIRALITKGVCDYSLGDMSAVALVEEGHLLAQRLGHRFEETLALVNLTGMAGDVRDTARAEDLARRSRDTAVRYEFRPLEAFAQAQYAEFLMWKGDWIAAEDAATGALGTDAHTDAIAWRLLALIHARRGRTDAEDLLDRMWTLAGQSTELQLLDPAAAAIAEYLWLSERDDPERLAWAQHAFDRSVELGPPWPSGAFAFWWWKLGHLDTIPDSVPEFYRLIIDGRWAEGAEFWGARNVPYEQALALMHGGDDATLQALRIFEHLGATATAARIRKGLLARGVRVPRGASRATREHAAGLTARQAEVLDLLAERLSNSEIADRLFVSHRTVENHVAAILMKLDVSGRDAAVRAARERGIIDA